MAKAVKIDKIPHRKHGKDARFNGVGVLWCVASMGASETAAAVFKKADSALEAKKSDPARWKDGPPTK